MPSDMFASWRHQMETFFALLALCMENSPATGEFPSQRPVTRSYVFFELHLNKRLNKPSRRCWFETPSLSLWRHCNGGTCFDTGSVRRLAFLCEPMMTSCQSDLYVNKPQWNIDRNSSILSTNKCFWKCRVWYICIYIYMNIGHFAMRPHNQTKELYLKIVTVILQ